MSGGGGGGGELPFPMVVRDLRATCKTPAGYSRVLHVLPRP